MLYRVKFFVLFLLFGIAMNANSQPYPEFAPVGAVWRWHMSSATVGGGTAHYSTTVKSIGVDTIKGKECKKLYFGTGYNANLYFYRDSLIIYYFDSVPGNSSESRWRVLYDFTKNVGESYIACMPFPYWPQVDSMTVTVLTKGDTVINGFTLPYMVTSSWWQFDGLTILNIGSEGYFIPYTVDASMYNLNEFSCYYDPIIGHYYYDNMCNVSTDVADSEIDFNTFQLIPNPSAHKLSVKSSVALNGEVKVKNIFGQTVLTQHPGGDIKNATIDVSNLANGVYFLSVYDVNGNQHQTKFVKSD